MIKIPNFVLFVSFVVNTLSRQTWKKRLQVHQPQSGAAGDAVGIAERFLHLKMIEPFAHNQFDRFTGGFNRGGEVAVLALELRRLLGAIGDNDRRVQFVEMALGAERLFDLVGEIYVLAALRESYWLQIIHAANQQSAFDDVRRHAEFLLPIGDQ